MTHEEIIQGLYDNTLVGNAPEVKELTERGVADGLDPEKMLYDAAYRRRNRAQTHSSEMAYNHRRLHET